MKTRMMGGAGGYGGISTMNQDQRGPRYAPHRNTSIYTSYADDTTTVTCLDCGQRWTHPRGDRKATPVVCEPLPTPLPEFESDDVVFEAYVTERNEVGYRPRAKGEK